MRYILLLAFSSLTFHSCTEQVPTNALHVFDNTQPESAEYRKALARLIREDKDDRLQYIFDQYLEQDGKTYLSVSVLTDSLNAKALVEIKHTRGIEKLVENKGAGYSGAELVDLQVTVEDSATSPRLIYNAIAFITD
jgi:hypothetical protein